MVHAHGGGARRELRIQALAWAAVLTAAAAVLAGLDFHTRDPDSALHVAIVTDLAGQPLERWLAPEWGGHWDRQGLFKEHPAGLFLLSWPLVAAGYPPAQAPLAVNAVFQALCLLLLVRLARVPGTSSQARATGWLLQVLPIAFVFRIRANHEQLLLFFYLAALVAAEEGRKRPAWFGAVALATAGAMLVKGVFAVLIPASCALWLLWRPAQTPGLRLASWFGLALAALLTLAVAGGYELAYRRVTGEPFVLPYLTQQLGLAAEQQRGTALLIVAQKFRNLGWYAGRLLWYALPWSLVCLWLLAPRMRRSWSWNGEALREAALFLALTGLYLAALSLSDRRADRYGFPAYYLAGLAGAMAGMRHLPFLRRLPDALARLRPLEHVVVWAVAFALALSPLWDLFPKFKLIDNY
jgi:4-amino-4-deoxy-L-arabinose transferase-like glycosyltransferase